MIINKDNKNKNLGDLFDAKFKVYIYYNEKGEIVKSISKPVDKKFIKEKNIVKNFKKIVNQYL